MFCCAPGAPNADCVPVFPKRPVPVAAVLLAGVGPNAPAGFCCPNRFNPVLAWFVWPKPLEPPNEPAGCCWVLVLPKRLGPVGLGLLTWPALSNSVLPVVAPPNPLGWAVLAPKEPVAVLPD